MMSSPTLEHLEYFLLRGTSLRYDHATRLPTDDPITRRSEGSGLWLMSQTSRSGEQDCKQGISLREIFQVSLGCKEEAVLEDLARFERGIPEGMFVDFVPDEMRFSSYTVHMGWNYRSWLGRLNLGIGERHLLAGVKQQGGYFPILHRRYSEFLVEPSTQALIAKISAERTERMSCSSKKK